jgi:hypothetical protein
LPGLDAFLADHPAHRRGDFGVAVIEQGLIELGLGLLNRRLTRRDILQRCISARAIGIDGCPGHLRDAEALLVILPSGSALGRKDGQPRHIIVSLCAGRLVLTDFAERRLVVRLSRFHLRLGLTQPSSRTLDSDDVIGWIDICQKLSCADRLSIDHIDAYDGTVDPRADRDDMSIDLRIVGAFIRRQIAPSRYCDRRCYQKEQDQNEISPATKS